MDSVKIKAAVMAMGFLLLYAITHAQKKTYNDRVWKKEVAREINFTNPGTSGNTLLQMIISDVKAGKINAYSNFDHRFSTKLTSGELDREIHPAPDTVTVVDPVNGQETMKIIPHDFDYTSVTRWRIYEDWTFNYESGHTEIQIQGIAPIKAVYVDGDLRGYKAMFWTRYPDVSGTLARYEKYHPANNFKEKMWNDYFSSDTKAALDAPIGSVWKNEVYHTVDMGMPEDTARHHLRDIRFPDTSISEMIIRTAMARKLTVYKNIDHRLGPLMTVKELEDELIPPDDTSMVVDPVTRQEMQRIIHHDIYYEAITKYSIMEEWSFNLSTGKIEVQITGIAPSIDIYVDGEYRGVRTLFWVKYPDVANFIDRYEQYHPNNSFALHIWNDYFQKDAKPAVTK